MGSVLQGKGAQVESKASGLALGEVGGCGP